MSESTITTAEPSNVSQDTDVTTATAEVQDAPVQGQEQATEAPAANETPEAKAARLEAEVTRLRRENGKERVTAKQKAAEDAKAELAQQIGKALGLVQDEAPVDPAQLTVQLQAEQVKAADAERRLAVYLNAGDADPARLLDSRTFTDSIKDLDPTNTEGIKTAISAAVESNPWLKATTQAVAPRKAGTEMAGGSGETSVTQEQFNAMSYQDRARLFQNDPNTYRKLTGAN